MVVGRQPDREIMGHPQKATESWSFLSSDFAGESRIVFPVGMRSQSPWALAVGVMIPTICLPCWIICHSMGQSHSPQCEEVPGSSFLHRDLFQKGSPKPLTRLGCQLLAWKLESPWRNLFSKDSDHEGLCSALLFGLVLIGRILTFLFLILIPVKHLLLRGGCWYGQVGEMGLDYSSFLIS